MERGEGSRTSRRAEQNGPSVVLVFGLVVAALAPWTVRAEPGGGAAGPDPRRSELSATATAY
jgi:hypothetical protein